MATPPRQQHSPANKTATGPASAATDWEPEGGAAGTAQSPGQPRIDRPAPEEMPLGFKRLLVILMSSHIGVRSHARREEDFRRANGLHVAVAGVVYFALVIAALVLLVNLIAG